MRASYNELRLDLFQWWCGALVTGFMLLSSCVGVVPAAAASVYTYVTEEGAVVATDNLEEVPTRYRGRMKITQFQDAAGRPATPMPAPQPEAASTEGMTIDDIWAYLPDLGIAGLTKDQSFIVVAGMVCGTFALAIMMLSQNPGIRFAMKWVLTFVIVGVMYSLYFSGLRNYDVGPSGVAVDHSGQPQGVMGRVRSKANDLEQLHQDKANRIERAISR